MEDDLELLKFAHHLADLSRQAIRRRVSPDGAWVGHGPGREAGEAPGQITSQITRFDTKDDLSPVTEVDREVERTLRDEILLRHPDHGFYGEESGTENLSSELVWVIDPIDGTKAFLAGIPVYSTLISLARCGKPFLGVMDFPATGLRIAGLSGRPTMSGLPGEERVESTRPAGASPVMSVSNPDALTPGERAKVAEIRAQMGWAVYGGSTMGYARLAMGSIDLCLDAGLDAYDYCSLVQVIRGAGGEVTDWEGGELGLGSGHRIAASGDRALHGRILEILSRP